MQRQGSFSQAEYAGKKKQTRRDKFLAEMEQVVPWARLVARLQPFYPKGERGRPPVGLERMLRLYFLQQWYGLADEALEDALYDSQALRGFAGIDLAAVTVPDATTVMNFRHWLERHDLTKVLFDEVGSTLEERGLLMRQGTIVDATIIAAPPSTKNKSKARDPEMHQTKKGNEWHFGMKAHIGVDVASGVVHTLTGTASNEADINQTAGLLHGRERTSTTRCRRRRSESPSTSVTAAFLVRDSESVCATLVVVLEGGETTVPDGPVALAVAVLCTMPASTSAWVIVCGVVDVQVVDAPGASVVTGQVTAPGLRVGDRRRRAGSSCRCS